MLLFVSERGENKSCRFEDANPSISVSSMVREARVWPSSVGSRNSIHPPPSHPRPYLYPAYSSVTSAESSRTRSRSIQYEYACGWCCNIVWNNRFNTAKRIKKTLKLISSEILFSNRNIITVLHLLFWFINKLINCSYRLCAQVALSYLTANVPTAQCLYRQGDNFTAGHWDFHVNFSHTHEDWTSKGTRVKFCRLIQIYTKYVLITFLIY